MALVYNSIALVGVTLTEAVLFGSFPVGAALAGKALVGAALVA